MATCALSINTASTGRSRSSILNGTRPLIRESRSVSSWCAAARKDPAGCAMIGHSNKVHTRAPASQASLRGLRAAPWQFIFARTGAVPATRSAGSNTAGGALTLTYRIHPGNRVIRIVMARGASMHRGAGFVLAIPAFPRVCRHYGGHDISLPLSKQATRG